MAPTNADADAMKHSVAQMHGSKVSCQMRDGNIVEGVLSACNMEGDFEKSERRIILEGKRAPKRVCQRGSMERNPARCLRRALKEPSETLQG